MAHKMGAGSTKNGRDSKAKRLGVKCFGNELVKKYSIIDKKLDSYDYHILIQTNNINNIF